MSHCNKRSNAISAIAAFLSDAISSLSQNTRRRCVGDSEANTNLSLPLRIRRVCVRRALSNADSVRLSAKESALSDATHSMSHSVWLCDASHGAVVDDVPHFVDGECTVDAYDRCVVDSVFVFVGGVRLLCAVHGCVVGVGYRVAAADRDLGVEFVVGLWLRCAAVEIEAARAIDSHCRSRTRATCSSSPIVL